MAMKKLLIAVALIFAQVKGQASMTPAERTMDFFKNLDKDHLNLVNEFYDENVEFQDPIHKIHGVSAVKNYYAKLYENVKLIRFEFSKNISEGNTTAVFWKMFLQTPDLNKGKEFSVDGNSLVTFGGAENKAIIHRDYFDMGEFIYERVPILRSIISLIKGKLSNS